MDRVERLAARHLRDVVRRVQVVGIDEVRIDRAGEGLADHGLAGTGHSHDDDRAGHPSRARRTSSTISRRTSFAVATGAENASRIGRGPSAVVADISNPYRSTVTIRA